MSIETVSFHVLTPEDVLKLSVKEISKISLHKKGQPHFCGPNSLFLGSTSNEFVCATCNRRPDECTGHTGHITLNRRILHPLYVGTVLRILRGVCFNCLSKLPEKGKCTVCKAKKQPKLLKKGIRILRDGHAMKGDEIWEILQAAEVTEAAGLVLENLLIPPVMIRPSVAKVSGSKLRGQDDLTMALVNIIRTNRKIREADEEDNVDAAEKQEEALAYYIACYMVSNFFSVSRIQMASKLYGKFEQTAVITKYTAYHFLFGYLWGKLTKLGFIPMMLVHIGFEIYENTQPGIDFFRRLGYREYGGDAAENVAADLMAGVCGYALARSTT